MTTSVRPPVYKFSRREIARHRCNDCSKNVIKAGDYCMLDDDIWERQFGLGWNDNLCLACIEVRLGREVTMWDFICPPPHIEGYDMSETLSARFHPPEKTTPKKKPKRAR